MIEPVKLINPFTAVRDIDVLSRPGEPYVLPDREPAAITDETVAAITQAVTQVFTELAKRKKLKTGTDAASGTLKPNNR